MVNNNRNVLLNFPSGETVGGILYAGARDLKTSKLKVFPSVKFFPKEVAEQGVYFERDKMLYLLLKESIVSISASDITLSKPHRSNDYLSSGESFTF